MFGITIRAVMAVVKSYDCHGDAPGRNVYM